MLKVASASAVVLALASSAALAAPSLTPGIYSDTLLFVNVTNDGGACAAQGVKPGVIEPGIASGVKIGAGFSVSTPIPVSGQGVADQVCQYATPIPNVTTQSQPYTGTVNCTLNGLNYQIVTSSGNGTIQGIDKNSFTINASSAVQLNGVTLCNIQTSQLFLRTGK